LGLFSVLAGLLGDLACNFLGALVTSFILSMATSAISRSRSLPASALPFE